MTPGPASPPGSPDLRPAGRLRRLAALLYEALLLVALGFVAGFVLLPLTPRTGSLLTLPGASARALNFLVIVAVLGTYCVHFWSHNRRTLPMKTWRLRLVMQDGREVDRVAALVRYAAAWIGPAFAILAYARLHPLGHGGWAAVLLLTNLVWALVDRDGQFLHDRIARTRLVHAR